MPFTKRTVPFAMSPPLIILCEDDHSRSLRDAYLKLMKTQFRNAGWDEAKSVQAAENVLQIETALAKAHITREMRRIPELNYHMMRVVELPVRVAPFDWDLYFAEAGAPGLDSLNVSHPPDTAPWWIRQRGPSIEPPP